MNGLSEWRFVPRSLRLMLCPTKTQEEGALWGDLCTDVEFFSVPVYCHTHHIQARRVRLDRAEFRTNRTDLLSLQLIHISDKFLPQTGLQEIVYRAHSKVAQSLKGEYIRQRPLS